MCDVTWVVIVNEENQGWVTKELLFGDKPDIKELAKKYEMDLEYIDYYGDSASDDMMSIKVFGPLTI